MKVSKYKQKCLDNSTYTTPKLKQVHMAQHSRKLEIIVNQMVLSKTQIG